MGARFPLTESIDPLLRPFLETGDASESERMLGQLIVEHVQPLAHDIARSRIRTFTSSDVTEEDICSEVTVQVLGRMRDLRGGPEQLPITNLRGYVATIVHNVCNHCLRRMLPERCRLKNQLRYVLNHHRGFATWQDPNGDWLCGLAAWKAASTASPRLSMAEIEAVGQKAYGGADVRRMQLAALLDVLFLLAGQPFETEQLVGLVAEVRGVQDLRPLEASNEDSEGVWKSIPDPRSNTAVFVERRMYLAKVWEEICELRPMQRAALLFNLRERTGQDMLPMLVMVGVAPLREIAASLDLSLEALQEMWDDLPLEDNAIAERLGVTRQQVINLRKSARERLARRMAGF